jgi:hypothetical protein
MSGSLCVVSIQEARRIVKQTTEYLVWVDERQAKLFREPGWLELQPHRDGGVLFLNRDRERRALLQPVLES